MKNDFCEALVTNDRYKLQKAIDSLLDGLDTKAESQVNFEKIMAWIRSNRCVASVEASPDLLDTDPPVKEFIINLTDGSLKTIGIRLSPARWDIIIK
jgi:hypothetical protein